MSNSNDQPQLTIYSTTWCGYCNRLKLGLKASNISWDEINIEEDPSAADYVASVNNGNHVVPTVRFADGSSATNPTVAQIKEKLNL